MKTWKRCGHPRTTENTCRVSAQLPGGRCRICRGQSNAAYDHSEKGRQRYGRYNVLKTNESQYWYDMSPKGRARHQRYQDRREEVFLDVSREIRQREVAREIGQQETNP